jgi:hypothetical protein
MFSASAFFMPVMVLKRLLLIDNQPVTPYKTACLESGQFFSFLDMAFISSQAAIAFSRVGTISLD